MQGGAYSLKPGQRGEQKFMEMQRVLMVHAFTASFEQFAAVCTEEHSTASAELPRSSQSTVAGHEGEPAVPFEHCQLKITLVLSPSPALLNTEELQRSIV
jgi:hypothetical protein